MGNAQQQVSLLGGSVSWYLRALFVALQVLAVTAPLTVFFGVYGLVASGLVAIVLTFRHVHRHVRQELRRAGVRSR